MTELQTGDTVRMQAAGETLLIGQRIAEGGQGIVYQAELNGEIFAVKLGTGWRLVTQWASCSRRT